MPHIGVLAKTRRGYLDGTMEAEGTVINSAVFEGLNNKIRTSFKRSYGFNAK
jgi:transposase